MTTPNQKEERARRFDEKFPEHEYFENHSRLAFEGADDKVLQFLSSEILLAEEALLREMINRISHMNLWSKGSVEGTRQDIMAKLKIIQL